MTVSTEKKPTGRVLGGGSGGVEDVLAGVMAKEGLLQLYTPLWQQEVSDKLANCQIHTAET